MSNPNPNTPPDIPYAAAFVEFLDRDTGKVRRTMCYPITRVVLMPLHAPDKPQYGFRVDELGQWVETAAELPPPDTSPLVADAVDQSEGPTV